MIELVSALRERAYSVRTNSQTGLGLELRYRVWWWIVSRGGGGVLGAKPTVPKQWIYSTKKRDKKITTNSVHTIINK